MSELEGIPNLLPAVYKRFDEESKREIENAHEDAVFNLHDRINDYLVKDDGTPPVPINAYSTVALMNLRKRIKQAERAHDASGDEIYTRLTFDRPDSFLDLSVARKVADTIATGNLGEWMPSKPGESMRFKVFDLSEVCSANDPLAAVAVKLTVGHIIAFDKTEVPVIGRHYGIVRINDSKLMGYERTALKVLGLRDKFEKGDDGHYGTERFEPFAKDVLELLERATTRHGELSIVPVVESLYTTEPVTPPQWIG